MNSISRFRRWAGSMSPALGGLLLLGSLVAGVHHHVERGGEDGCATCALAHSTADTPIVVAVPTAAALPREWVTIARAIAPESATPYASPSRAPPLS